MSECLRWGGLGAADALPTTAAEQLEQPAAEQLERIRKEGKLCSGEKTLGFAVFLKHGQNAWVSNRNPERENSLEIHASFGCGLELVPVAEAAILGQNPMRLLDSGAVHA
ncbi:hypothetical protein GUJ93_ZPchr0007g3989 [Zizania palustris]|uniref:Uncharacterized protein n=1 Tax=Zizania palustris TaxID=103762 RepID=A0A8J5SJ84_ZIZPA|nr:hypothetical protein GUJ93_ZPchr0007g3989 [Zizania palustris]